MDLQKGSLASCRGSQGDFLIEMNMVDEEGEFITKSRGRWGEGARA